MRYSVTGVSRQLTAAERALVRRVIADLRDATEITTGCAEGVDTVAHIAAMHSQTHVYKRLCVPAAPHNTALVTMQRQWHDHVIVERCLAGSTNADSYMIRNGRLVNHADVLIAFPATDKEELRSGTWATIRRARRAGIDVEVHPLAYKGGRKAA